MTCATVGTHQPFKTWFGTRNLGSILGSLYISGGLAVLLSGSVAGRMFDSTQSYTVPILGSVAAALLATRCLTVAHRAAAEPILGEASL